MQLQIILLVGLIVYDIMLGKVFMFQRTVRKIAMRVDVDQRMLSSMYPPWMLTICRGSTVLRLAAVVLLFYLNWKFGLVFVGEYILSFIIQMILPTNDYRNMEIILTRLKLNQCRIPDELRDVLIDEIESILNEPRVTANV